MSMTDHAAFGSHKIMAFVATSNPPAARHFYRDVLGLELVSEDDFALAFDANGTMLRVTTVEEVRAAQYTVLGWRVGDIVAAATRLRAAGVKTERYPGMRQDGHGIWTSPSGARVAWFKDPDGNTLSITQF
jgi:catechol 2,3-dioxygenase-like lactoylglutathione lyase family enzyme